jgi:hypothetical protein
MLRDVLLSGARDVLGRAVHEHYRRNQDLRKPPDDLALQPWDELTEDLRESNRKQADHIPVKLKAIGCSFRPVAGRGPAASVFAGDEVETMARLEHERWMQERRLAGWTYGEQRESEHRKSPYLVPYDDLADGVKDWDREAVWSIPAILALAKFEVYRL